MNFAEKLDALVAITGTTNAKISRGVNIDPSMVSKWRKGVRNPGNNMEMVLSLAEYFAARITVEFQRDALVQALGKPIENIQNKTGVRDVIFSWLMEGMAVLPEDLPLEEPEQHGAEPPRRQRPKAEGAGYKYTGRRGREKVMKAYARRLAALRTKVQMTIYSDEPNDWMKLTGEYLRRLEKTEPEAFRHIEQVQLYVPAEAVMEQMEGILHFAGAFLKSAPVVLYQVPKPQIELFQHMVIVVRDFFSLTALGTYGNEYNTAFMQEERAYVNSVAEALNSYMQCAHPAFRYQKEVAACNAPGLLTEAFATKEDLLVGGQAVCPFVLPPALAARVLQNAKAADAAEAQAETERIYGERLPEFLQRNKLYCCMPLLTPKQVKAGAATLPLPAGNTQRWQILDEKDYLEVLRYIQQLERRYPNFVFASGEFRLGAAVLAQANNLALLLQQGDSWTHCAQAGRGMAGLCYSAMMSLLEKQLGHDGWENGRQHLEEHIVSFERMM